MKPATVRFFLVIFLALGGTSARAQTRRPPPRSQYSPLAAEQAKHPGRQQPQTWYEFALSRINPGNFNYGDWMEEHRRALLEASLKSPYFKCGLALTIVTILLMAACAKLSIDGKRKDWLTAEMMADLMNQDQRSREFAKEAIQKYNNHIERCNRVIEAAESGHPIPGSATEADEVRAKLRETEGNLAAVTRDKNKFQSELEEKKLLVAKLSLRVDEATKRPNGNEATTGTTRVYTGSGDWESETTRLMHHINNLQQQLYAEQKKNERLRGA